MRCADRSMAHAAAMLRQAGAAPAARHNERPHTRCSAVHAAHHAAASPAACSWHTTGGLMYCARANPSARQISGSHTPSSKRRSGPAARASALDADTSHSLRVSLPTKEAQQSIKFALARAGKETAVLINRLAGGTAAAEAGVRPGQRLLSISDPMSANGMWDLNDRPSIRFVRDALAMRSADTITLVVSRESVYAPGGGAAQTQMSIDEIDTGAAPTAASSEEQPANASNGSGEATVAEKLAQQYRDSQAGLVAQQTAFERRQRRRKEFFEKESSRDDGGFFLVTAAVILLPAIGILAIAYFSGYLDQLSDTYTITK